MNTTKSISQSLLIITYILAAVAIWVGLVIGLHIPYTATGMEVYSLFDTAPTATLITALVLALCCFSIIPDTKIAWVRIALRVASFMEVLALAGPVSYIAMKLIYSEAEIENAYSQCVVNCGLTCIAVMAVLACINYFIQSRNKSIKALSVWTIGGGLFIIFLSILAII